jgi:hypothetical protein
MDGLEAFLDTYGLAAACAVMLIKAVLALIGLGAWVLIARRRRTPGLMAVTAWTQATCPVCLAIGGAAALAREPAVRWEGAA